MKSPVSRTALLTACLLLLQPVPAMAQTTLTAAQKVEDLTVLERQYVARERAFDPAERAAALALIGDLKARAESLSDVDLYLGVLRVVALADNGHSLGGYSRNATPPNLGLPFIVASMDPDGLLVLRARPGFEDLAGAEVTAVEGRPMPEVMGALGQYFGGNDQRKAIMAAGLFRTRGMLHGAGLAASPDRVTLTFRDRAGRTFDRTIDYVAPPPNRGTAWWPSRWWSSEPLPDDASTWTTAVPVDRLPLYLRNANQYFQTADLPEMKALYIQFWVNEAERGIADFVRRADAEITAKQPRNIIVDLRFDKGGDLRLNAELMRSLAGRIPEGGRVYLIIGRYTFSAGMVAAAIAVKAGGDKVLVVGEAPGDDLQFWSEGDSIDLPNSHYAARYTDGYFDLVDGCTGELGCHRENSQFDFVIGQGRLDIPAPMTAEAYLAGRDPAMEAIAADIRSR